MAVSYYKIINGKRYDRQMLKVVDDSVAGREDGLISLEAAKKLFRVMIDGNRITETEKNTFEYIREEFSFDSEAEKWLLQKIEVWEKKKKGISLFSLNKLRMWRTGPIVQPVKKVKKHKKKSRSQSPKSKVTVDLKSIGKKSKAVKNGKTIKKEPLTANPLIVEEDPAAPLQTENVSAAPVKAVSVKEASSRDQPAARNRAAEVDASIPTDTKVAVDETRAEKQSTTVPQTEAAGSSKEEQTESEPLIEAPPQKVEAVAAPLQTTAVSESPTEADPTEATPPEDQPVVHYQTPAANAPPSEPTYLPDEQQDESEIVDTSATDAANASEQEPAEAPANETDVVPETVLPEHEEVDIPPDESNVTPEADLSESAEVDTPDTEAADSATPSAREPVKQPLENVKQQTVPGASIKTSPAAVPREKTKPTPEAVGARPVSIPSAQTSPLVQRANPWKWLALLSLLLIPISFYVGGKWAAGDKNYQASHPPEIPYQPLANQDREPNAPRPSRSQENPQAPLVIQDREPESPESKPEVRLARRDQESASQDMIRANDHLSTQLAKRDLELNALNAEVASLKSELATAKRSLQAAMTPREIQQAETKQKISTALTDELSEEFSSNLIRFDKERLWLTFLPSESYFDGGSARLNPSLKKALRQFFPSFVETLIAFEDDISEIRFQGHSSSYWKDAKNKTDAYLKNLTLSNARAEAALKYCLGLGEVAQYRAWLEDRMVSSGFSDQKPVLDQDKTENPIKSRRITISVGIASPGN